MLWCCVDVVGVGDESLQSAGTEHCDVLGSPNTWQYAGLSLRRTGLLCVIITRWRGTQCIKMDLYLTYKAWDGRLCPTLLPWKPTACLLDAYQCRGTTVTANNDPQPTLSVPTPTQKIEEYLRVSTTTDYESFISALQYSDSECSIIELETRGQTKAAIGMLWGKSF